ncbi:uracil-DNA glycosylase [Massilia consociata]|uniref:Uracil-DNA glycosylase n=1 Tax=Massilia consociata TaxID=760117 RepID=A0ABV6FNW1_9BURK
MEIEDTPFVFRLHPTWYAWLNEAQLLGPHFTKRMQLLLREIEVNKETLWPVHTRWLAAFEDDPEKIRVVLLGQDPYPTPHRATGHSFEIAGMADDSLRTIYAAIHRTYPMARIDYECGDLSHWRNQGVLLLNAALSVCGNRLRLVKKKGELVMQNRPRQMFKYWSRFTKGALRVLCERRPYLVFMLWGRPATNCHTLPKGPIKGHHGVTMSYHPSDLAQTVSNPANPPLNLFQSVAHFRQVNNLLQAHYLEPIDWSTLPP